MIILQPNSEVITQKSENQVHKEEFSTTTNHKRK